jgi:hypothetical protein
MTPRPVTLDVLLAEIEKMREEFKNPPPQQEQYMYFHPNDLALLRKLIEPKEKP